MTDSPFPVDPVLTGITLAYRNRRFIADAVLPRIDPPFEKSQFKYQKLTKDESYTIPDTKVGRRSAPNEVGFTGTEISDTTEDYGLEDPIPIDDINQASQGFDVLAHATESLTELVALDREKRVADLVFAAAQYPTGNKETLSGTDQWSDAASKPIAKIQDALDTPVIRPNVMVIGRLAFTVLSRHADIVKSFHMTAGDTGIATRQHIASLFELDDVLVGESFYNTAKPGQTASLSRVWGKHAALLWIDPLARGSQNRISFGFTAQYGTRVAGSMPDSKIGLRGGVRVRVGEGIKEVVAANDVGYFLENVIA